MEDLERFSSRVERAFKQDIELKAETTQLGNRLQTLKQKVDDTLPTICMLRDQWSAQDQKIEALLCQLDDFENRSKRANIRDHGLFEGTDSPPCVAYSVKSWNPATAPIEIDRAQRALYNPRPL